MSSGRTTSAAELHALRVLVQAQRDEVASLVAAQRDLRALIDRHHIELMRHVEQLRGGTVEVATEGPTHELPAGPEPVPAGDAAGGTRDADYRRLVIRVRALVRSVVPAGATVVVVSRGDDDLLALDGRAAWHFPCHEDGRWAGFHPRDSAAALAHLAELRGRGADHFVLPATARWWFDHYVELRVWLERHARLVVRREDTCLIYALPSENRNAS